MPQELRGTNFTFTYNNREQLQDIVDKHGDRLAAIVMEPCRTEDPEPGFLEFVRDSAHGCGALLIFDEVSIGWRLHFGGSHLHLGVNPDMAVFAKAISNGHPMGAVIGTTAAMEGAHGSFISSTYWTESVGPAAALATLRKMSKINVPGYVARIGRLIQGYWRQYVEAHRLPVTVPDYYPCNAAFQFDHEQAQELRTLYTQLMLERGFLASTHIYPSLAHTEEIVACYRAAIDEVFAEIAEILAAGDVDKRLQGPVAHRGFQRLL